MTRPFRSSALLAAAVAAACGGAAPAGDAPVIRDSAGIMIVENPDPAAAPEWMLGEPDLAIGGPGGGEAYELYQALHGFRLPDGGIVLANQGTKELRFYDAAGRHVRTVGRAGGGPGEFQEIWGLYRAPGDSLAVWDWRERRLTLLDSAGTFGRLVSPTFEGGFVPRMAGILDDGTAVMIGGFNPGVYFASGTGVRDDSVSLYRFGLDRGALLDSIGPLPGYQRFVRTGEGSFWMRPVVFGRQERFAVAGSAIIVGDDRSGEVRYHQPGTGVVRIVRLAPADRQVRPEHITQYREGQLQDVEPARLAEERRRVEEVPVADRLPAFTALVVDRLGRVWLRDFSHDPEAPAAWTVLDAEGRLLARLTLPARTTPLDAGRDYLLAHHRDDLDVEEVTLFPLRTETTTP